MTLPSHVKIVEVGPRDGLQNQKAILPVATKVAFIRALAHSGLSEIEATSFVSPRWIPQLADAEEVSQALFEGDTPSGTSPVPVFPEGDTPSGTSPVYVALVPNRKGLERALACGYRRVAVFTAASEAFSQKNTNRSVAQSLEEFAPLVKEALAAGVSVRGYVSTAWFCPYSGRIPVEAVVQVSSNLLELGIDEVSLGDTVGLAVPTQVEEVLARLLQAGLPSRQIALHFHDTSGTALANVLAALQMGFAIFDSSAGGLGGCPYAPGASGNLATEDLLYLLDSMGIETGVRLAQVAQASQILGLPLASRTLARLTATP